MHNQMYNTHKDKLQFPELLASHTQQPSSSLGYLSPYSNYDTVQGQGFSLSLSSAQSSSFSSGHAQQLQLWNRVTPLGPFTGYAAVLGRSRFLEPTRRILEDVCGVGHEHCKVAVSSDRSLDIVMFDGDDYGVCGYEAVTSDGRECSELRGRRSMLISLLDEVYKRYKQYYQQVQAVIASFESVAGLSTAAPYASMVLKTMNKHFMCLKNKIVAQLRQTSKVLGKEGTSKNEISGLGLLDGNCLQRVASNTSAFGQPHVWRPQRGLPERAVSVLRAWLFEHFLHPYPTDPDKQMLANQTGLTRNQVSNWFINARVRLWKPMVEEIHTLEMGQKSKTVLTEKDHNDCEQAQHLQSPNASLFNYQQLGVATTEDRCTIANNIRKELSQTLDRIQQPINYEYNGFSNHHRVGNELDFSTVSKSGVSLTLGLKQNYGTCFPEQLQINVARQFGLEDCSDAYMISSFGSQDQQFDKNGGDRLLHDFVG